MAHYAHPPQRSAGGDEPPDEIPSATTRSGQGSSASLKSTDDVKTANLKLAVTIEGAAQAVGVSRSGLYQVVNAGGLPARKFGSRTLVLVADLEKWLRDLPPYRPGSAGGDA